MIKQMRVGKGLSQEELAQIADISVRTLQRVESGDAPSLETARSLASALEVSLDTIRGDAPAEVNNVDAIRHVKKLRGFYAHLIQYAIGVVLFFTINLWTSPQHLWAIYPTMGWGVGVLFHASAVFGWLPNLFGGEWERKQIEKHLAKQRE